MKTSRTKLGMLALLASALYVIVPCALSAKSSAPASAASKWNVLVDRISPGETNIDPAFQEAIYENLIQEVNKTQRFNQVFRDSDRRASEASNVLILKTEVQKYRAGSETRRAVTTFTGATKIRVDNQLCTRDGQVVFQSLIDGNVRFIGGNLRATHNLARHLAKKLKDATLPDVSSEKRGSVSDKNQVAHISKVRQMPKNVGDDAVEVAK